MLTPRTTLITGATDGIGLALAKRLQARGDRLILVGRRPVMPFDVPVLQDALYCQADLTESDSADKVAAFLEEAGGDGLDLLIHNAGTGYYGALDAAPQATTDAMVQLNLLAPIRLTHRLLPRLRTARGRVCFVSSVVSSLPAARYAVYAATKAGLEGFARSLRTELGGAVGVQIIRPGATRTGLHRKMGVSVKDMPWDRFPDAASTADRLEAALGRKSDRTLGFLNRVAWATGRCFPRALDALAQVRKATAHAQETPDTGGRKRCLVTGAAKGIGLAFARTLARDGAHVVGVDADREALEAAAANIADHGAAMTGIGADLCDAASLEAIAADVAENGPYDLVVHCAGINAVGRFGELPPAPQEAVIAVNFLAPVHLTTLLLQCGGLRAGSATVFVASLSCYTGYPGASAYAASKDALSMFARGLDRALGRDHTVTTVYPGPVDTGHAARYSPDNGRAGHRMAPESVAAAMLRAVARRKRQVVPGGLNRLAAALGHWTPSLMDIAMRRAIFNKLGSEIRLHEAPAPHDKDRADGVPTIAGPRRDKE